MQDNGCKILIIGPDESIGEDLLSALGPFDGTVIAMATAAAALPIIRGDPAITAVLVDIMLAGAEELIKEAEQLRPGLRLLYTTTYPEMLLLDREVPSHRPLLRKPFERGRSRSMLGLPLLDDFRTFDALREGVPGVDSFPTGLAGDAAAQWRHKAEELRTIADNMIGAHTAATLRRLADSYEVLARRAENRAVPAVKLRAG